MTKKIWLLTGGFVLVSVISIVAHVPAAFVLRQVTLPAPLQIEGISGTVWQGKAQSVSWQRQSLGEVRWSLSGWKLLMARLEATVRFGRGSDLGINGKGVLGYGFGGAYARDLVTSMAAENALRYAQVPLPIGVSGQLVLTIDDWRYQAPYCSRGEGELAWGQAGAQTPLGDLDLGPVVATIRCENSSLSVAGQQSSAQVSSEFSAELQANQSYTSQAWFKPGAEFPGSLQSQLRNLPKPDAQGRYQFSQGGRL